MANTSSSTLASSIGLAFFVSASGLMLVSILTVSLWRSFEWMGIAYGLGVFIPTIIAVRMGGGGRKDALIGAVISALIGATTLFWQAPQTRMVALQALERQVPVSALFSALDDVEDVSVIACQALLRTNYDRLRFRTEDFAIRPHVTANCLGKGLEGTDADKLMRRDVLKV